MAETRLNWLLKRLARDGRISEDEREALRQSVKINAGEAERYDSAMPPEVRRGIISLMEET